MASFEMREFVQQHCTGLCVLTFTGVGLILLRRWMTGGVCRSRVRLDGKTVIVTGANVGIGKETAKDIARRGARVILACRDLEKAEKAAAKIREETGNGNVLIRKLDLASLKSVRAFAKEIQDTETQLDVLINNAGIMWCPKWKTEDGFEMQFGVNHLGHFLLTNLLLDLLKKSAPSRIVNVASLAHKRGKINFDDINLDQKYDSVVSYSQSKLANVLFTRELAKRLVGTGVTANSLHPGLVMTDLGRHVLPTISLLLKIAMTPLALFMFKNSWQGAQTNIHCAVAEELKHTTGLYFSDCAPKEPAPQAKDGEVARRLWDLSAQMVGLDK
ncbi:retinol dehydrogenase 13 [Callorhinchus milii]|uniref:Retinol dehydrogenase-like protein n=1 Tax=Callorhinchus milii TaxID=7868 RepID=V9KU50_CALMI|nr:retinol dehydrogenase 13 [Callorhinchus milii]|eukprot:gi/632938047/ref/XP_007903540.1/ PREDICTED: retinol dehydrogenase 13-like [Callorhinchus milii]